jgi:hypothetical protein
MARPKHKPTDKDRMLVKVLAGVMAEQAIANAMQICRNTLRKNYKNELKEGKDFFLAQAITALMNNIKKGKEASIFFYLKTQHGWKDSQTPIKDADDLIKTIQMVFLPKPD